MEEADEAKGYITYDYDAITRSVLLTERKFTDYNISHNNTKFRMTKPLKKSILIHMENVVGITVKKQESLREIGRENIFKIKGTKSKIIKLDGKPFIEVRLVADDPTELYEKIFKFRSKMKVYEVSDQMCTWDKDADLVLRPDEISNKKVVEFDPLEVKSRKQLELETFRQN